MVAVQQADAPQKREWSKVDIIQYRERLITLEGYDKEQVNPPVA